MRNWMTRINPREQRKDSPILSWGPMFLQTFSAASPAIHRCMCSSPEPRHAASLVLQTHIWNGELCTWVEHVSLLILEWLQLHVGKLQTKERGSSLQFWKAFVRGDEQSTDLLLAGWSTFYLFPKQVTPSRTFLYDPIALPLWTPSPSLPSLHC